MEMTLFILSAFFLQLPFSFYQHSVRKYERLRQYNPMDAINYVVSNGDLDNMKIKMIVFVFAILAFIPLKNALNIHWLFIVLITFLALYLIIPFISFIIYPKNRILNIRQITFLTVVFIVFAIIFFIIGVNVK